MSDQLDRDGTLRKLWPAEAARFRDHLMRLDPASRRMRFSHGVSDAFIEEYASRATGPNAIAFGYIVDGEVRAAAELRKLAAHWGRDAEAAFSVERAYQNRGIGSDLMGHVIRAARNRGVAHLYMSCLADNRRMQALARKYRAQLRFEYGEVIGEIVPNDPTYFSLFGEALEDRIGFLLAVLDLSDNVNRAA